ncbi:P1 family peptidase [Mycobacterium sp. MBM]|nr:P1 family peptidase [Mycobacterium sp. MBM]
MRARDLGVVVGKHPTGPHNAITDVPGVRVGHTTLQDGGVHTGVTVILPHGDIWTEPVFAGSHVLNGSGELTGLEWIRESGELTTAVGLTNTHSVGVVRDALVAEQVRVRGDGAYWSLPVVGETYDGFLNDINGFHVRPEHVQAALASASDGPVGEGNVGGGTGMICHQYKGGIGTASRVDGYTVGVLVQANHGRRERLRINGVPVTQPSVPLPAYPPGYAPGSGSIIVIIATDAPLLPHQCRRLAQRGALGVGRLGGTGEQYSGDLMLAFATGNRGIPPYGTTAQTDVAPPEIPLCMVCPQAMDLLFDLTIEATEEAIVNAMVAAETVTGHRGYTVHAIDHELLTSALREKS